MKRSKLTGLTGAFLILMLLFTVLSRAADSAGIANVTLGRPQNMMIAHVVRGTGRVEQNQERAVVTEAGQRVGTVYVNEGQKVEKGDLLFGLDMDSLEEAVLQQKQEIRKMKLQIQDAASQESVGEQQRANAQAQAAENYSLSAAGASRALSRAKENLEKAKKELKDYRKEDGAGAEDTLAEQELEQVCEECSAAYVQAQQNLQTLQWRIEKAVDDALRQAGQSGTAGLVQNMQEKTGASDGAENIPEEAPAAARAVPSEEPAGESGTEAGAFGARAAEEIRAGESGTKAGAFGAKMSWGSAGGEQTAEPEGEIWIDSITVEETKPEKDAESGMPVDDVIIESDKESGDKTENGGTPEGSAGLESSAPGDGAGSGSSAPGDSAGLGSGAPGDSAGSGNSSVLPLPQQEADRIEQEVRSRYAAELEEAQQAVDEALAKKQKAEAALDAYRQEILASRDSQSAGQEQQLIDAVKAAQTAYEDAAIAANEAAVTGKRSVETAGLPEARNSTIDIYRLELSQKRREFLKLKRLEKAKGRIKAPVDGIVTGIYVTAGDRTPDGTAVMLADLTKGCRMTAEIPQDQEKYIGRGDLVTVESGDGKTKLEEIPVESVRTKAEDESVCLVTVQIPENKLQIGTAAELSLTKKSAAFPLCIPLAALYLDEKNQTYVLAVQEINSVLGTEMEAVKVMVTVEDRNDQYAALAQGSISASQNIIVSSDRPIDEGSRVRVVS